MKKIGIALTSVALTMAAQAQTYAEMGYTAAKFEETVVDYRPKASPSAIRGVFGYDINPHLSVEGLIASGTSHATLSGIGSATDVSMKIDNIYGLYAKPKLQLSPNLEGFLRFGFAHVRTTTSYLGRSDSSSGSSFSTGLGVSYAFDRRLSMNIDAMSYYDKDASTTSGVTLGIGYKF